MSDRPTSFHDFKWACGHTGPGYCKTCRDEQIEAKGKRIAELVKTNARLLAALETYADAKNWNMNGNILIKGLGPGIAKRALAATEQGEDND